MAKRLHGFRNFFFEKLGKRLKIYDYRRILNDRFVICMRLLQTFYRKTSCCIEIPITSKNYSCPKKLQFAGSLEVISPFFSSIHRRILLRHIYSHLPYSSRNQDDKHS